MKFDDFLGELSPNLSPQDRDDIKRAYEVAVKYHAGQTRASGDPYVTHCVAVAKILNEMNLPGPVIAAGLLHDIVEDTPVTLDDVRRDFGDEVTQLVDGVTKLTNLPRVSRLDRPLTGGVAPAEHVPEERADQRTHDREAETIRKTFLAMGEDVRVVLIKLADRLHNMRTLKHLKPDKQRRIARETLEIFAPLANRLGIWRMKWELEDLGFRYVDPDQYKKIAGMLDERRGDRERTMAAIIQKIRTTLAEHHLEPIEISGRPKHIYSIWKKMNRKQTDFDRIYDVRAVRVIVKDIPACYVVLGVIHSLWRPQPGEFDDYIATPKENFYQSLHTAVVYDDGKPLEVQIRTPEMHENAEFGIAAHWRYKEGTKKRDEAFERRVAYLRQLMEWQSDLTEGRDFVEALKTDVFQDRVYAFTPRGDIVDLPMGATPIDFAYHVHTAVGERCRGAKVNGKLVSLNTALRTGDQVEIITAKRGGPSRDWLNPDLGFVKSARAREKIRNWFKKQDYEQNVSTGRALLERELNRLGIDKLTYEKIAEFFSFEKVNDFMAALGCGDIHTQTVVNRIVAFVREQSEAEHETLPPPVPERRPPKTGPEDVTIQGTAGLLTHLAKCCNPVKGDPIIGFTTRGRGITIHRQDCPNAVRILETERLIQVNWGGAVEQTYAVPIRIQALDREGLLRDVSTIVADEKVSMSRVNVPDVKKNMANILLTLQVSDLTQLGRILNRIEQLPNVLDVRRWKPG
ncbi:MAG: bifunctional (p)ppGpp synthetase/guanosine-3',5'-bis(diphosphate) 3'-pyrophosphohydrolase [Chloroflexi bacterium]|nr:bifunctional (p)ppGpp synthetase/guanosine-3',5'-bis(diphosphate) 3'-pyrophosphohydrolase [Chloroflexota bacterium]